MSATSHRNITVHEHNLERRTKMMTNERKELKMMKVSEMRRINAGSIELAVLAFGVFVEAFKIGWEMAKQKHQGRCGC